MAENVVLRKILGRNRHSGRNEKTAQWWAS